MIKGRKIKNLFIRYTIKTPLVVFLTVFLMAGGLWTIAYTSYTSVYASVSGELSYTQDASGETVPVISGDLGKQYLSSISKSSEVNWFLGPDREKHSGSIISIESKQDKASVTVLPSKQDVLNELGTNAEIKGQPVEVEIFLKREKVIKVLF